MATQNIFTTNTTNFSKGETATIRRWDYVIDFTVLSVAQNDVLRIIGLPKGATVLAVQATIITPATAATTMSLGDSGSGTRFATTLDVTQAANTVLVNAVAGRMYSAADDIRATIGGASPTVGKIVVSALVVDQYGATHLPAGVATL